MDIEVLKQIYKTYKEYEYLLWGAYSGNNFHHLFSAIEIVDNIIEMHIGKHYKVKIVLDRTLKEFIIILKYNNLEEQLTIENIRKLINLSKI